MNYKSVDHYILHRPPMLLLESVMSAQADAVVTSSCFNSDNIFLDAQTHYIPNWVGVEMLAQTAGVWVGMQDLQRGRPVQLGFLLGVRSYITRLDGFELETRFVNKVQTVFTSGFTVVFKGEIFAPDGSCCAEGEFTAFRPDDVESYLRGDFVQENSKEERS